MKRSRAVSTQNSKGVEFLLKKNKIAWIKGTARIAGATKVEQIEQNVAAGLWVPSGADLEELLGITG